MIFSSPQLEGVCINELKTIYFYKLLPLAPFLHYFLRNGTVGSMKSWQYGKKALMTLYFTLQIYKHVLGLPESLTESPSTSISSSGASAGVNLEYLAKTQLPGWQSVAEWSKFTIMFENHNKIGICI